MNRKVGVGSKAKKPARLFRNVGLGFKTPQEVSVCRVSSLMNGNDDKYHDGLLTTNVRISHA